MKKKIHGCTGNQNAKKNPEDKQGEVIHYRVTKRQIEASGIKKGQTKHSRAKEIYLEGIE
jgi:hypothetical protein